MSLSEGNRIVVDEPNWTPLEMLLSPRECMDYMYMGRVGDIALYKHVLSRRYLNISSDGQRFFRKRGDEYVETSKAEAIDYIQH